MRCRLRLDSEAVHRKDSLTKDEIADLLTRTVDGNQIVVQNLLE